MKSFKGYFTESSEKRLHLTHIEDVVIDGGVSGIKSAISHLQAIVDLLSGSSTSKMNLSEKFDGAPAIICGINPENGKFFVATKSAFNVNPKLNYTAKDIDKNHPGGVNSKLKVALAELSNLGIRGILQGDMMFTQSDLKTVTIDGDTCVAFKPNTITYAAPKESKLGQEIARAQMGIIFHTTYTGNTIPTLTSSAGANISNLTKTSRVWVRSATFKNVSGVATFTTRETAQLDSLIQKAKTYAASVNPKFARLVSKDTPKINSLINTYINSKFKTGTGIPNPQSLSKDLIFFINDKYQAEIRNLKTQQGQQRRKDELDDLVETIKDNKDQFVTLFNIHNCIIEAKEMILSKLQSISELGTFIETDSGFQVTAPEGFVAVSQKGDAFKLVDRMTFSRINFTAQKDWD